MHQTICVMNHEAEVLMQSHDLHNGCELFGPLTSHTFRIRTIACDWLKTRAQNAGLDKRLWDSGAGCFSSLFTHHSPSIF